MANKKDVKLKLNFDLMRAAKSGNSNGIESLLKAGADVNTKDSCFRTALYHAALNGHAEVCKTLVANGTLVDTQDKCQRTPLYPASSRGYTEIVKCLLEHGAHVNATDKFKDTPLHLACGGGRKDVIQLLILKGANLEALNLFNEKPTDVAKCNGHQYIIAFIHNTLKQMGLSWESSSPVEGNLISPSKKRKQLQEVNPNKKMWGIEETSPNKKLQGFEETSPNKKLPRFEETSPNKKMQGIEETSPNNKQEIEDTSSNKKMGKTEENSPEKKILEVEETGRKCECGRPFEPVAVPFMEGGSQSQCTDFFELKYKIGSLGTEIEELECRLKLLKLDRQKFNELSESLVLRLKNVRKLRELRANDEASRLKWTAKMEEMTQELQMTKENETQLDCNVQILENKINEIKMERGKVYIEVDEFVTSKYNF